MTIVLKSFDATAKNTPAKLGTAFSVTYEITGNAGDTGTIVVSCTAPYGAAPDIPVAIGPGEAPTKTGTAQIAITGPAGAATVTVCGTLVETHCFPQDVE